MQIRERCANFLDLCLEYGLLGTKACRSQRTEHNSGSRGGATAPQQGRGESAAEPRRPAAPPEGRNTPGTPPRRRSGNGARARRAKATTKTTAILRGEKAKPPPTASATTAAGHGAKKRNTHAAPGRRFAEHCGGMRGTSGDETPQRGGERSRGRRGRRKSGARRSNPRNPGTPEPHAPQQNDEGLLRHGARNPAAPGRADGENEQKSICKSLSFANRYLSEIPNFAFIYYAKEDFCENENSN